MPSDARAVAERQIEERRNSQADRGDERPRRESRHGGGGGHRRSSQHRGDGDRRRSTRSGAGASSSNDSPTTGPTGWHSERPSTEAHEVCEGQSSSSLHSLVQMPPTQLSSTVQSGASLQGSPTRPGCPRTHTPTSAVHR